MKTPQKVSPSVPCAAGPYGEAEAEAEAEAVQTGDAMHRVVHAVAS
ncbi:hypothetical protein ABZ318_38525 [Streptomyces sp. NPDC006197]